MGRKCCVPGCKSNYNKFLKTEDSVSTFLIPKNKELRRQWLKAIPRKNWTPSNNSAVCVQHFSDKDVERFKKLITPKGVIDAPLERLKLVDGAVPSIFQNEPSYLSKQKRSPEKRARKRMKKIINHQNQADNDFLAPKVKRNISCNQLNKSCINGKKHENALPSTSTANENDSDDGNDMCINITNNFLELHPIKEDNVDDIDPVEMSEKDDTLEIEQFILTHSEINTENDEDIKQEDCHDELSDKNLMADDIDAIHIKSEVDLEMETYEDTQYISVVQNEEISINQISDNQKLTPENSFTKIKNDSGNDVINHGDDKANSAENGNDVNDFLQSLLPVLMMMNGAQVNKFKDKVVDLIEQVLKESPNDE